MKSTLKITIAVAIGALGTLGGWSSWAAPVSNWRPYIQDAQRQALERRTAPTLEHGAVPTARLQKVCWETPWGTFC